MGQLPRDAVCSRRDTADLDASRAAIGVDAAQPKVMFAGAIHLSFETSRKVLNRTTHELRVSVRCIKRCIWGVRTTLPVAMHLTAMKIGS